MESVYPTGMLSSGLEITVFTTTIAIRRLTLTINGLARITQTSERMDF
jgi:hypothetical protein